MQTARSHDNDKSLYAAVAREITQGIVDAGLWTKAYAQSGGVEASAKAQYIELRVAELRDEIERRPNEATHTQAEIDAKRGAPVTCPRCGHRGEARKRPRGNVVLAVLGLLAGIVPGLIYAYLHSGFRYVCRQCGAKFYEESA